MLNRVHLLQAPVVCLCGLILWVLTGAPSPYSHKSQRDHKDTDICSPTTKGNARVVFAVVWSHYPEVMSMQVASIQAFLRHEFVYMAVANCARPDIVQKVAKNLSVDCFESPFDANLLAGDSHATALNNAIAYLLQGHNFSRSLQRGFDPDADILSFLDSDMFLVSPMNLHRELRGAHVLTVLQGRTSPSRPVHYLWPNFCVFHFSPFRPARSLYMELNMSGCGSYGNTSGLDTGGCTAALLDNHQDIRVTTYVVSCSIQPHDNQTCQFLRDQNALRTKDFEQCSPSYIMENEWLSKLGCGQSSPKTRADCKHFGKIFHMGSAGSNWRRCPEAFLQTKREALSLYLHSIMTFGRHKCP